MGLGSWFKSLWGIFASKVKKLWNLASPFLKEILSKSAQAVWASSQDIFIEAVQYVAAQGLPTDSEKQEAFRSYLKTKLKDEISELKTSELNLLMEMAVSISKKVSSS